MVIFSVLAKSHQSHYHSQFRIHSAICPLSNPPPTDNWHPLELSRTAYSSPWCRGRTSPSSRDPPCLPWWPSPGRGAGSRARWRIPQSLCTAKPKNLDRLWRRRRGAKTGKQIDWNLEERCVQDSYLYKSDLSALHTMKVWMLLAITCLSEDMTSEVAYTSSSVHFLQINIKSSAAPIQVYTVKCEHVRSSDSFSLHPGCGALPPLGKKSACPRSSSSPTQRPAEWITSTNRASEGSSLRLGWTVWCRGPEMWGYSG